MNCTDIETRAEHSLPPFLKEKQDGADVRGTDISSSLAYPGEAPLTLVVVRLIANKDNEKNLK
jgi:hypothetical protein